MTEKHILPEEVRMIIDFLARDGLGQEGEGSNPVGEIEKKLRDGGIGSEFFGDHFPRISHDLKIIIAIRFLYAVGFSKLGLDLNMPSVRIGDDEKYYTVPTIKHLENIHRIWTIIEKLGEEKDIYQ